MKQLLMSGSGTSWAANRLCMKFHGFFYGCSGGEWNSCFPYNRLIYIIDDQEQSYYEDGDRIIPVKAGSLLLIPAYHPVIHHQSRSMNHCSLHFSLELYPGADVLSGGACRITDAPDYGAMFCPVFDSQETFTTAAALNAYGWLGLVRLCGEDIYEAQVKHAGFARYEKLLYYLEQHCHAGINTEEMAEVMGMNQEIFCRKFREETGIPPKRFFNRLLAARAEHLLIHTDRTIREIALELKFCNEFYFSRFFRRCLHSGPREYRSRMKMRK